MDLVAGLMMNALTCRSLFFVTVPSVNFVLYRKLFGIHPYRFGNVLTTEAHAHSDTHFSQIAANKVNLSEACITQILNSGPRQLNSQTLCNVEKVIHSFQKRGFSLVQIHNIMRTQPQVIRYEETFLKPKFELLEEYGFVDGNLVKLLTANPRILCSSLEKSLLPSVEFLKKIFSSQDIFVKALVKAPLLLSFSLENCLKPSLAFWEGWGFSGTELLSFLRVCPSALSRRSLTPEQVGLIQKISADRSGKVFKYLVAVVATSRMKTLETKIENLVLCGLSTEEVWQLLRICPQVLRYSKENIREKMNFIVKNMELPANYVIKHTGIFAQNLEKTMKPRFLVWQKIKTNHDIDLSLLTVFNMPEERFINKFLEGYPDSKTLRAIYESAFSMASCCTKSSAKTSFWMPK